MLRHDREQATEPTFDLQDWIWRLRRYGLLLVLPFVVSLCAAFLYVRFFGAPMYKAFLLVSVGVATDVSPSLRPLVQDGIPVEAPSERVSYVDGKVHNHTFLRAIVVQQGLDKDRALRQHAAEATKSISGITADEYALRVAIGHLWSKITVVPGRGNLVQIAVSDPDPQHAQELAAAIGEMLLQENLESTLTRVQARGEFSKDQVAVYEDRLKKAESALRTFQEGMLRQKSQASLITEENLSRARSLHRASEQEVELLRSRIASGKEEWQRHAGNQSLPFLSSGLADRLAGQLGEVEVDASLMALNSTTPGVGEAARQRIASTRQALFAEFDRIARGTLTKISTEARTAAVGVAYDRAVLRSVQTRRDRLAAAISRYIQTLERTPRDQMELQRLQDDVTSTRKILETMRGEALSSGLSEALATSQIGPRLEIVEPAQLPLSPAGLGSRSIYVLALMAGLAAVAGIVFVGERLVAVVRTVEQAELEYGYRVLGVVPRIKSRPRPGSYLRHYWPALAICLVVFLTVMAVVVDATLVEPKAATSQVQRPQ